jgi:hypothetical protein
MPRWARPRRRAIFVDAPVSSMNTNRSGIRLGLEPCASPRENVGPLLLAGVRCFFSRSLSDDQENARSCSAQIRPHAAIKASRPVQQA